MNANTAIRAFEAFESVQGDHIWSSYGAEKVGNMLQTELIKSGIVLVDLNNLDDMKSVLATLGYTL